MISWFGEFREPESDTRDAQYEADRYQKGGSSGMEPDHIVEQKKPERRDYWDGHSPSGSLVLVGEHRVMPPGGYSNDDKLNCVPFQRRVVYGCDREPSQTDHRL